MMPASGKIIIKLFITYTVHVCHISVLEKLNNYLYMYISVHVFKMYKVNVIQYLLLEVHYPSQGLTLGSLIDSYQSSVEL